MSDWKPVRIQLSRKKGWKMPENTEKVDRTTAWGNPFIINPHVKPGSKVAMYICVPTATEAVEIYREYIILYPEVQERARRALRGKNLACWCPLPKPGEPDI